jgi:hypothetical protein
MVFADFVRINGVIKINYAQVKDNTGECRINPPSLIEMNSATSYFGFPIIANCDDMWCGEFEARATPKTNLKTKEFHKRFHKPPVGE